MIKDNRWARREAPMSAAAALPAGCRPWTKGAGIFFLVFLFLCLHFPPALAQARALAGVAPRSGGADQRQRLGLGQCIELALKYNALRKASQASRDIAEAQYKQALSAYWPQLTLTSTGTRLKNPPLFVFPAAPLPLGNAARPLAEAIAATQLLKNPLSPPPGTAAYNAALAGTTDTVLQGLQSGTMPAQEIKLMDRDTLVSSLELIYPLYTGGKRSALVTQAGVGVEVAREAAKRTDLQIIHDVKVLYYSSILCRDLLKLGRETLERFEITLELTENLYKHGSGKVKKTDYLRTKVIVASLRSFLELLKSNELLARAALANAMGLNWQEEVEPAERELPFAGYDGDLEKLVAAAQQGNPQMVQVQLGLKASEARIKEARAGHLPLLIFFGNFHRIDNSYDAGIMAPDNKENWSLGLRMELPLFSGFRTTNAVKEASARVEKLRQEGVLLKEGLALQVKDAFLIRLEQVEEKDERVMLRFSVSDTGIGVSLDKHRQIFDAFTQADASTTRKYGGTGLGLTISKQLVGLMGGEIGVENRPGGGSTFHFTAVFCKGSPEKVIPQEKWALPRADIHRLAQLLPLLPGDGGKDAASGNDWTGCRILVAEDNPVNKLVAMATISQLGCQADAVGTGKEALAALSEMSYDLVLMDCQMPEMDGYEATKIIREKEQGAKHPRIPIIALTAHAMQGDRDACLAAGMDDYLAKPFHRDQLLAIFKRWII